MADKLGPLEKQVRKAFKILSDEETVVTNIAIAVDALKADVDALKAEPVTGYRDDFYTSPQGWIASVVEATEALFAACPEWQWVLRKRFGDEGDQLADALVRLCRSHPQGTAATGATAPGDRLWVGPATAATDAKSARILAKPGKRGESTTVKAATERVAAGEDAKVVALDYGWDDDALVYVAEAREVRRQLDEARAQIERMRPVVEAANRYRTHPALELWNDFCKAVDAYDAAERNDG